MACQASLLVNVHGHVAVDLSVVEDAVSGGAAGVVAQGGMFVVQAQAAGEGEVAKAVFGLPVCRQAVGGDGEVAAEGELPGVPGDGVVGVGGVAVLLDQGADSHVAERHRRVHVVVLVEAEEAAEPCQRRFLKAPCHEVLRQPVFPLALRQGEIVEWQEVLVERHVVVQKLEGGDAAERHYIVDVERRGEAVGEQEAAVEAGVVVVDAVGLDVAVGVSALVEVADKQRVAEAEGRGWCPIGLETSGVLAFAARLATVVFIGVEAIGAVGLADDGESEVFVGLPVGGDGCAVGVGSAILGL